MERIVAKKKTVRKAVKKAVKKVAKKKTKRKSVLSQIQCELSSELAALVGAKKMTRPQIVKKIWAYIKAHKRQDSKNRRMIVPDAKLATVLGSRPIDMMKMAGALSKHIKK